MANIFNIRLTATDDATKVINRLNKSTAKLFAPYDKAKQSAGSFFDTLGSNELVKRSSAGLQSIGRSISQIGSSFGMAENSVLASSAGIAARLMQIGGPIGTVAAGAVVAGGAVLAVGVSADKSAQRVDILSKSLGMSATSLQEWEAASKRAGLTSESMDQSLKSLSEHLVNSNAGFDPDASNALEAVGIRIKTMKNGAVDVSAAMMDIAKAMSAIDDPNMQRLFADTLGVGDQIQLLRQGRAAIEEYIRAARQSGQVLSDEQISNNAKQASSYDRLKGSIDGLTTSVGDMFAKFLHVDSIADGIDRVTNKFVKMAQQANEAQTQLKVLRDFDSTIFTRPNTIQSLVSQSASMLPIGLRNNNPGNLRSWAGAGSNGGFATFPTASDGLTAAAKNLLGYQDKYGINTISGIVNRWAPASDGNNVSSYIGDVSKRTGFGAADRLDMHDPKVLTPLLSSIVSHENGQNPYDPQVIAQAVAQAIKESMGGQTVNLKVEGMPPGMSIKQSSSGAVTTGLSFADGGAY